MMWWEAFFSRSNWAGSEHGKSGGGFLCGGLNSEEVESCKISTPLNPPQTNKQENLGVQTLSDLGFTRDKAAEASQ